MIANKAFVTSKHPIFVLRSERRTAGSRIATDFATQFLGTGWQTGGGGGMANSRSADKSIPTRTRWDGLGPAQRFRNPLLSCLRLAWRSASAEYGRIILGGI